MTKKQEGGKIEGGRVLIFSKDVINDGKIVSSGSGAKIHIETETYSGRGTVESHSSNQLPKYNWVKNHLILIYTGIVGTVIAGLVLYYFFGIGK